MATLGLTSTGTVSQGVSGDSEEAWYIGQMPVGSTLTSITVDLDAIIDTVPIAAKVGILSGPDAGVSAPTTLIAEVERTNLSGRAQYTFTAAGETLPNGAFLWIVVAKPPVAFTGLLVYQDATTALTSRTAGITYPTLDPNPTSSFANLNIISGYITYGVATPSGSLLIRPRGFGGGIQGLPGGMNS